VPRIDRRHVAAQQNSQALCCPKTNVRCAICAVTGIEGSHSQKRSE
jgi:hypothetical protein